MPNQQPAKILIVEDEVMIAEYIEEILQEEHFKNIKIAHDKTDALAKMKSFLPDIILMDINLHGKNDGIELAKAKNENVTVVFITGQQDYALMNEALKTNPDAYLTKPIKKMDVLASINLAIQKKQSNSFQFKDGHELVTLNYSDIKYFVAEGNYITVYTKSKKYSIRQSLNTIMEQLPSTIFKQTHRSYLVNLTKTQRITATSVVLKDVELPLSRTYAKDFK